MLRKIFSWGSRHVLRLKGGVSFELPWNIVAFEYEKEILRDHYTIE